MEKQLLLNSVELVERKTNCVFLLSLCGSFECTLATPVLIFERGAKKIFDASAQSIIRRITYDGKGRWRANMGWVLTSYVTVNSHVTSIKI